MKLGKGGKKNKAAKKTRWQKEKGGKLKKAANEKRRQKKGGKR
jgi:hypothetical protein